jgi:Tol biopolymer transport system component
MWASQIVAALLLALVCPFAAFADEPAGDTPYVIFVSQREGAAGLFLLNLNTRQVSQLTDAERGHITPAASCGTRLLTFAARAGSSYELFTAQISSDWRTRRPRLAAINRLTIDPDNEVNPTLSGDGNWLVFASGDGIEIMSSTGQGRRVLVPASPDRADFAPALAPDGRQVAFVSNRSGTSEIWLADTTSGALRQLTEGGAVVGGLNWSQDSQQIVFTTTATPSKLSGIAIANAASGAYQVLTQEGDGEGAISPGGTRIIFTSLRSGDPELHLLDIRTGAVERLTNNPGADGGAVFIPAPAAGPIRRSPPSRRETFIERTR